MRTKWIRLVIVLAVAAGGAGAAVLIGGPPPGVAFAADEAAAPAGAPTEARPDTTTPPAGDAQAGGQNQPVREMSQAEIDAELEAVERALDQKQDPGEAKAETPLPADLGVAFPSDI